jgi:predicted chitinase
METQCLLNQSATGGTTKSQAASASAALGGSSMAAPAVSDAAAWLTSKIAHVWPFIRIFQDWKNSKAQGYEDKRKETGNDGLGNVGNASGPGYSFRRLSSLGQLTGRAGLPERGSTPKRRPLVERGSIAVADRLAMARW